MLGQVLETHCNISFANIRTGIDIFGTEKCKVTFGIKYITYAVAHRWVAFCKMFSN